MKEQSNELFFVEIRDSNEVRKNILESLKEILEVLHRFEKFKQLRHEKLEQIHKLRILVKSTAKLTVDLRNKLPQTSLKGTVAKVPQANEKKIQPKKTKKAKIAKTAEEKAPKKEKSEVEKLESELSAIESKLKDLV